MKITIIGTGYVGLVTGTCFAEMGNDVTCIDIDQSKIEKLKNGILPIYEPGLDVLVENNFNRGNLRFSTDMADSIHESSSVFIAVGTPMGEDGSADLQYVLAVAKQIGSLINDYIVVVDKSTVPVGTADLVQETIQNELKQRGVEVPFDVVSNPEFLKEGAAVEDFMKPDRVVVGCDSEKALGIMRELYRPFTFSHERFVSMDVRSAEMTKYTANAMLATKISFMNEIANICERVGANVNKVRLGIGSDSRIGFSFIYPGVGYGGSCFPKDVSALAKTAAEYGYEPRIINAVEAVNKDQRYHFIDRIAKRFNLSSTQNLSFAVWGLSFKPETDDMREAPAIEVITELTRMGAHVQAYDPQATEEARTCYLKDVTGITYCTNKYDALNDADALILLTEWKEFRSPDFLEIGKRLKNQIIFDGRNQYSTQMLQELGFEYYEIGVSGAVN